MTVLKRNELEGYATSLVYLSAFGAGENCRLTSGEGQAVIRKALETTGEVDVKITVAGVEVDAKAWLKLLEQSIVSGYNERVARDVEDHLTKNVDVLYNRLGNDLQAIDDLRSELRDRALRLTRDISEDAYWTTSASQNC